nr:TPA_asm: hypothetical protein HUJ06_021374 [Nelumbo nucifera]
MAAPSYSTFPQVKSMKTLVLAYKRASIACSANSNSHRRNPDFSRQNRQGISRSRNRQTPERESSENLEEPELLSSKNGPLFSLSSSPRFQATATPGPREKEIVELFRKVQAQLRERAAMKEEKKIEASQGRGRESETVDSLLKLLRKHSVEQGKRRSSGTSKSFVLDQSEQSNVYDEEQNTSFFDSNSITRDEVQVSSAPSFTRPASNFRRKSPVPRVKYQPVYSTEDGPSLTLDSPPKSLGRRKKNMTEPKLRREPEPEPEPELEPEPEREPEPETEPEAIFSDSEGEAFGELVESSSDTEEVYHDDEVMEEPTNQMDLSKLKLSELRVVAKSRGVKGFSKLKKGELLELLGRNQA